MKWKSTQWNDGVKVTNTAGGGFIFVLPQGSGHVNSVQSDLRQLALGQTLTVTYMVKTISGKPKFIAVDREGPANFSIMLAEGPLENRWYIAGVNYVILADALDKGLLTYSVKLKPRFWQDVNGKQDAVDFRKSLSKFSIIQIVFGGKFRAHGVQIRNGSARFQMKSLKVET